MVVSHVGAGHRFRVLCEGSKFSLLTTESLLQLPNVIEKTSLYSLDSRIAY